MCKVRMYIPKERPYQTAVRSIQANLATLSNRKPEVRTVKIIDVVDVVDINY